MHTGEPKDTPKAREWLPFCEYESCLLPVFPCPICMKPGHCGFWVNLNDPKLSVGKKPTTKVLMVKHAHFLKNHDKWRNYSHSINIYNAHPDDIRIAYVINQPRNLPSMVQKQFNRFLHRKRFNGVRERMFDMFRKYNERMERRRDKLDKKKADKKKKEKEKK